MKCFVHLGYDPVPKTATSPSNAIAAAETHLSRIAESDDDDPSSKWLIRRRNDEQYPDNFCEYTHNELLNALVHEGAVVLQLVKYGQDNQPMMGEICNIFTCDVEKMHDQEAEIALEMTGGENYANNNLDLHGESRIRLKRRIPSKK